jgi:CheY-like chemotaxis protein
VDRASRLTGQLLAFARRQALKPEVLNVADRIEAVIEMLSTVVGSRIDIVSEISDEPCRVMADASQFETALVNMAVNARDAMDGEGVLTIRVHRASQVPAIRGQEAKTGEFVRIAITDTGSGIAPDQLGQIFEPFFTTKEIGKGTGLGLSQVYGFTKQSGGDVLVQSQIGSGTTFSLYLPRVEGAPETQAMEGTMADGAAPDTEDRRRRVLIVEDNVDVGTFTTQILEDLGYETEWADNADEAHDLLAGANGFDAVFSDVVMPGKSGIELGQEIRRRYPGLPIVLTSGYSHVLAEEGRHGFELLHKPYAAEDLSRILRRVIRDHGARQTSAVNPKTGDLIP